MATSRTNWQVQTDIFHSFLKLRDNPLPGVPHRSTEDDVYEGYCIPNGSIVICNSWYEQYLHCNYVRQFIVMIGHYRAMLYSEDEYSDPSTFNPERFMKDRQLDPNIRNPTTIIFGFGRRWTRMVATSDVVELIKRKYRLCPRSHIGFSTLWLTAVTVLATFKLIERKYSVNVEKTRYI
jgi:hypothetical protein